MNSIKRHFLYLFICFINYAIIAQNQPPGISVSGRDAYCPLSQIFIAENFTISDPDNTGIPNFYIQISSGYDQSSDRIFLTGNHPTINSSWDVAEGRLTLSPSSGSEILFPNLEAAVRSIVFESTSVNISGSTSVFVPEIENTTTETACGPGSITLTANASVGQILWYDSQTGGNLLATGNSFTTPILTITTPYYATVSVNGCQTLPREEYLSMLLSMKFQQF